MTPLISILFPTIRPELFQRKLEELRTVKLPGPCEVVVVSDFIQERQDALRPDLMVRYFYQPRGGTVDACNEAFAQAQGDYIYLTNDETSIDVEALPKLYAAGESNGEGILTPHHSPSSTFLYAGKFFAAYPFGRRTFFQSLNGGDWLFDPAYRCFYADPDLSLRVHAKGLPVSIVYGAEIRHQQVKLGEGHVFNRDAYYRRDQRVFQQRWAHLGDLTDPG